MSSCCLGSSRECKTNGDIMTELFIVLRAGPRRKGTSTLILPSPLADLGADIAVGMDSADFMQCWYLQCTQLSGVALLSKVSLWCHPAPLRHLGLLRPLVVTSSFQIISSQVIDFHFDFMDGICILLGQICHLK